MHLDTLRAICLRFPAVKEDLKWGNLVFCVGEKMFCIADLEPPFASSFKVRDEDYEELAAREGFAPAPYLARAKWIQVSRPSALHRAEWEERLRTAYELVKAKLTKKDRATLGL